MTGILQSLLGSVSSAVAVVTDAYFNLVTLLLPGNGTNGAQNNTFLDSSTNNFTITRNGGNPGMTQGTFSPFSQTGWGNFFDGSSRFRATASSLSSSLFTVEAWVYYTGSSGSNSTIFDFSNAVDGYGMYLAHASSGNLTTQFYSNNTGTSIGSITSNFSGSYNNWAHVAVTYDGSTYRMFVNGFSVGTPVSSVTQVVSINTLTIAARSDTGVTQAWNGYISNFRYVTGAALYTSNFTPATSPLGIAGSGTTRLLTCQSNRFVDNSSSPYTFTISGTPSVQAFSPFAPTAAYSAATVGGSGYFDGTGDYLSIADNAAFDFGSSDFTLEAFVYCTDFTPERAVLAKWTATGTANANSWYLFFSGGTAQLVTSSNGSAVDVNISGGTAYANAWNHIAASRSGNTYSLYLNGTRVATTTNANSLADVGTAVEIGRFSNGGGIYAGYISGVRIVKGTAVYTGTTLTVPTAPLTAITNTSLLCNFTNAGIIDATAKNDLETVGNASISTTQSKFGGSSMYFDGTGDYLITPSKLADFGSGNFTAECWVYIANTSVTRILMDSRNSGSDAGFALLTEDSTGYKLRVYRNNAYLVTSSSTLSANTWYHVAFSRSGTTSYIFIDGTQVGSASDTNSYIQAGSFRVGAGWNNGDVMNGYIDDLRITKGYARYTANFTAPTAAFPLS